MSVILESHQDQIKINEFFMFYFPRSQDLPNVKKRGIQQETETCGVWLAMEAKKDVKWQNTMGTIGANVGRMTTNIGTKIKSFE